jgi:putative DNA primase/helicase
MNAPVKKTKEDQMSMFALKLRPEGLLALTSIKPGGHISTRTFNMPDEVETLTLWAFKYNKAGYNVYFTPNPVKQIITKKASVEDIAQIEYVFTDIDPDTSNGYEEGRDKLLARVKAELVNNTHRPTWIINSGNGVNVLYKLSEPLTDKDKGKRLNQGLVAMFDGDRSAVDVSRILRMPFTTNYPSQAKIKKGYPESPSTSSVLHGKPVEKLDTWLLRSGSSPPTDATNDELFDDSHIEKPDPKITLRDVKEALSKLDPNMGEDQWKDVGMILCHQGQGDIKWLDTWDKWSSSADNYEDRHDLKSRWNSWKKNNGTPGRRLKIGTLFRMVRKVDPNFQTIGREEFQDLDSAENTKHRFNHYLEPGKIEGIGIKPPVEEWDSREPERSKQHDVQEQVAEEAGLDYKSIANEIQAAYNNKTRDTMDIIDDIVNMLAAATLLETHEEQLINQLQEFTKTRDHKLTKAGVLKAIKTQRKALAGKTAGADGEAVDIEEAMLEHLLAENFEKGRLIRCIDKTFWLFDKGRWTPEDPNRIMWHMTKMIMNLRTKRPKEFRALVAAVSERATSAISSSLTSLFAQKVSSLHDANDPLRLRRKFTHPVMNTKNCEIHIHPVTGEVKIKEHRPESFLDVRLNVEYDPDAKCPEWDRFCGLVFEGSMDPEDMQRHLEEWMGYVLNFHKWMKRFGIFMGYTDAGKSTIVDVLKSFLDDGWTECAITMFAEDKRNQFTNGMLLHKMLLVDEERSRTGLLPDAALKSLAEEKPLTTDIKYSTSTLNFVSRAFPLIVSNHWPRSADVSEAFTRRAMVWHFKHEIPEHARSDRRRDKMLHELPGILNRLVAGLSRLRARGEFKEPMDCLEAKKEWQTQSNPVVKFIRDALVVDKGAAASKCSTGADVYRQYQEWASMVEGTSIKYQLGKQEFWQRMGVAGHRLTKSRQKGYRRVNGVTGLVDIESDEF